MGCKERPGRAIFLTARTFGHFSVDFACAFLVAGFFLPEAGHTLERALGVLGYNVTAFALQPIMGALCDKRPQAAAAFWGCAGVLAALVWAAVFADSLPLLWPALALCALGNALFHAGAGREVLLDSAGEMKWGGVFVSSGALGIPLGMLLGGGFQTFPLVLLPVGALAASLLLLRRGKGYGLGLPGRCEFHAASSLPFWAAMLFALVSVAVRSFVGSAVPLPWRTGWLAVLPGAASCLGKAGGGFLADRLGARRTGVLALLVSLPLLCLGNESLPLSLLGLFFFNCTMPVSLGTAASLLPGSPGLAFGMTAQLLIVGSLPLYLWPLPQGLAEPLSAGLILISALCTALSTNDRLSGKKGKGMMPIGAGKEKNDEMVWKNDGDVPAGYHQ